MRVIPAIDVVGELRALIEFYLEGLQLLLSVFNNREHMFIYGCHVRDRFDGVVQLLETVAIQCTCDLS